MKSAFFDEHGICVVVTDAEAARAYPYSAYVPEGTKPNDVYYDTVGLQCLPTVEVDLEAALGYPALIELDEEVQLGVPDKSVLVINGEVVTEPRTLDTSGAQRYSVELQGALRGSMMIEVRSYREARVAAYPPLSAQLETIYEFGVDGWRDQISSIRSANPKPISPDNREPLWEQVKALRDAKVAGGANSPFGPVQTDTASRDLISGAAIGAMLSLQAGQPRTTTWTMADNTEVPLGAQAMIMLGMAVLAHVDACFANARRLRQLIYDADDMTALMAVDINEGWPL